MITAEHKVLDEWSESRNNHQFAAVVQDLAIQWIQSHPCETKTSQETEKNSRKFPEPSQKPKVFLRTLHWTLAKIVKIYHRIIELQHLIDPRQMALLKEPFDLWKKALQQYCYNQDWMKSGGLMLWNAIALCKMSKTSWQTGNLKMN